MKLIPVTSAYGFDLVKVDDHHYDRLIKFSWHVDQTRQLSLLKKPRLPAFAIHRSRRKGDIQRKNIPMSFDVMGVPPPGYVWDHIDCDPCNNQESNFRLVKDGRNRDNRRTVPWPYEIICQKHPTYKAVFQPRCDCVACWCKWAEEFKFPKGGESYAQNVQTTTAPAAGCCAGEA